MPAVRRNHEVAGVNKMGCVPEENSPFPQRLAHQGDISLFEVPYSAVDQLCAAARRSLGKVV